MVIRRCCTLLPPNSSTVANISETVLVTQSYGGRLYDTIRYDGLTWTQKLSIQLNLAHVARKYTKEETKKTNASAPLIHYIREGSPEGIRVTMEERICERDEF